MIASTTSSSVRVKAGDEQRRFGDCLDGDLIIEHAPVIFLCPWRTHYAEAYGGGAPGGTGPWFQALI
jgi:hypothetical protein